MALSAEQFQAWLEDPSSIRCILIEVSVLIDGINTTLYLSNSNYSTGETEQPANTTYLPYVQSSLAYTQSLPLEGEAQLSYGDIALDNTNGILDAWLGYVWVNRPIAIYIGDITAPRADFTKVFSGYTSDIASQSRNTLNIGIRDVLQQLNTPITDSLVGGSGSNKESVKPLIFGEVHNISPVLIDEVNLTYMVHDGPIERIIEVRDNGVPITDYSVDLTLGTFTLNKPPVGTITCSVQGEKTSIDLTTGVLLTGTYSNSITKIIGVICRKYGTQPIAASGLDLNTLSSFDTSNPAPVGIYLTDKTNIITICQELANSVGAQFTSTISGLITLKRLTIPTSGTRTISDVDILFESCSISEKVPVQAAVKLGYSRNWTVQTELLTGLPEAHKALFAKEYLTTTAVDNTVKAAYKLSGEPDTKPTLLITNSPTAYVTQEATRLLNLWKVPRFVYKLEVPAKFLTLNVGEMLTLSHSRFGLSAGKPAQVVSIGVNWDTGRVNLEVLI